jgi:alkylhydroperoxidase family enzyme
VSPLLGPLDRAEAEERGLGDLMERSQSDGVPGELFIRLLAHVPGYAEAIGDAMRESHVEGNVDHRLKEIVRIQLARTARDPHFAGLRSTRAMEQGLTEESIEAGSAEFETDDRFSDAEKWALRYAYLMYRRPEEIDASFYEEGKKLFSEAQIMELGGMIALHYGMQRFMATLDTGNGG